MSLRSKILQGSLYLVMREGFGMVLSIAAMFLITRAIGPGQYGIFASAYGLTIFLQSFGNLGMGIYLVRQEGESEPRLFHQAFVLFSLLGGLVIAIATLAAPWIEGWSRLAGLAPILQMLLLFSFPMLLAQVPLAQLEHQLQFKRIAWVELIGQLLYVLIAFPLAQKGFGAWAPAIGWCAQQVQSFILLMICAKYRPRWVWDRAIIKDMLSYSVGISASGWVWSLQSLISPLIVGRFAGEAAVGYVALAIRLVDVLGFAKGATYRISIAALAKVQGDRDRLRRAVSEGMGLQILALGPLLVGAAWVSPYLLPLAFGDKWNPVMEVYPYIALCYMSNALFNLHSSVLYVLKKPGQVTIFHAAYVIVFAVSAFVLVPVMRHVGYGVADAIAIFTYGLMHLFLARAVGSPDYRLPLLWWAGFSIALFQSALGWGVAAVLAFILLIPSTRHKIQGYVQSMQEA
jgi:O-antigen/teichoic acid export membrane protein